MILFYQSIMVTNILLVFVLLCFAMCLSLSNIVISSAYFGLANKGHYNKLGSLQGTHTSFFCVSRLVENPWTCFF